MALSAALGIVWSAYAETPQSVSRVKTAPAKTSKTVATTRVTAKAVPARTTTSKPRSTTGKNNTKTSRATVAPNYRRSNQQQPSAERYQEIQQALADRGYFEGSADGQWGSASVEALKRFQREQSLTDDGKIGSLSLIALGLGPRRAAPPEVSASSKATQP